MTIILCQVCGKQGTLEEERYLGKRLRLRLRCPYCSADFVYAVPGDGQGGGAVVAGAAAAPQAPALPVEPVRAPEPAAAEAPVSAPRTEEEEAIIHEAKRIARLIVSEIKLYNQDNIAKARTKKEVLDILRNDLIKGKQHYNTRMASKLPVGPDYFMESVKEILLGGKQ